MEAPFFSTAMHPMPFPCRGHTKHTHTDRGCIYTHTHTRSHTRTCTRTDRQTHPHTRPRPETHTHKHTPTHTHTRKHTHTHTHTHKQTNKHTHTHTHTHSHTHIHTHKHTHTCTHIHTYTHTQTLAPSIALCPSSGMPFAGHAELAAPGRTSLHHRSGVYAPSSAGKTGGCPAGRSEAVRLLIGYPG